MKTGTTNDSKDGWMMGMSTKYAAGVWVGYHTRQRVMSGTMETMTLPMWRSFMQKAHDNIEPIEREKPAGLQNLPAFVVRSNPGLGAVVPSAANDWFPSWYKGNNKAAEGQTIDKVSNKLATNCTPERAKEKVTGASANQFSADRFVTGAGNANTSEQDDVHKCEDAKPSIAINASPSGNSYVLSVDVVQGTHALSSDKFKGTVNYIVDGQTVRSFQVDNAGSGLASFTYTPDFTGSKEIRAEIIDSVLYDSSDTATLTANTSSYTVEAESLGGNNYGFTWTAGGVGTITIYRSNNTTVCSDSATTSTGCNGTVSNINGTYAKDSSGKRVNVSGP